MACCKSCAAPLAANSNICLYCGVRNDVDLHDKQDYAVKTPVSERICPNCHIPLQTIDLKINGHLYIERCQQCFGLFFDPNELDILLDNSVSGGNEIDLAQIEAINQERYPSKPVVKYLRCPVCQVLMNRVNFGYRSGVVVDKCKTHGIWLDSGEITHLMEWKKAGGEVLSQQHVLQQNAKEYSQRDVNRILSMDKPYPPFASKGKADWLKILTDLLLDK